MSHRVYGDAELLHHAIEGVPENIPKTDVYWRVPAVIAH
jgi:hypothetical protein